MIAAAESSGRAAPDTADAVVVDRRVAHVDPKLGQFRGELPAYSAVPTELAQEVLPGSHGCIRCRISDDVGHETQCHQGDRIVLKRFSHLARHLQRSPQNALRHGKRRNHLMIMRAEHAVAAAKQTGHERSANITQFEQDFS